MRTRLTIMAIVLVVAAATIGVVVLLVSMLGWFGLAIGALGTITVLGAYRLWIQPWQHRWGATDEEIRRAMPGDDLIPDAASTTGAITIAAPPEQAWPWLVQLGYGRGGWYSYDWIDNDGQPQCRSHHPRVPTAAGRRSDPDDSGHGPASPRGRIQPVLPRRRPGSRQLVPGPVPGAGRLPAVSRWRVDWPLTPATAFWILLSDPGVFIMERKMLKGIRLRAEATARPGSGACCRAAAPSLTCTVRRCSR
jgi:hypothetical protein